MRPWSVDQALQHWQKEGLLTQKKVSELRQSLSDEMPSQAIRIFSAIGAILIGLGVILFVGSNWSQLTPVIKIGILLLGMMGTAWAGYYLAYEKKTYEKTGMALLFVSSLIYGASIFLVGQIYNLPLNFWWGMLLWGSGTALFSVILQSRMHAWLSIPLLVLFVGGLRADLLGNVADEVSFLFEPEGAFLSLMPILGVALISKGIFHRSFKYLNFASDTSFHWGLFLVLFPFVMSTIDKEFFFHFFRVQRDIVSVVVIILSLLGFLVSFTYGTYETQQGRYGLLALVLYIAFSFVLVYAPEWMGFPMQTPNPYGGFYMDIPDVPMITGLYLVHVALVVVMLLTVIWYGTLLKMPAVVNLGMIGLAMTIFIQYFSWAFELLDRSIAFILGGVLILGLSTVLERKRRQLLFSMKK